MQGYERLLYIPSGNTYFTASLIASAPPFPRDSLRIYSLCVAAFGLPGLCRVERFPEDPLRGAPVPRVVEGSEEFRTQLEAHLDYGPVRG